MKARLKAVMSQFYVNGLPADLLPCAGKLVERRNNWVPVEIVAEP